MELTARNEDLDFNAEDFIARVNSDLVGKYVNIASRAAGFVSKRWRPTGRHSPDGDALLDACARPRPMHELYAEREFGKTAARGHALGRCGQRLWMPTNPGSW